jgi:glycosyltransferase involved in cell wall biosynthesis
VRIAVDATALYGRYGGVEYSLWNLLGGFHAEDSQHEYCVYIPSDGPPPASLAKFNSRWRWIRLPFSGRQKLQRIFWQQQTLPTQLLRDGCDILHAPTYVAPLQATVPTVLTVYDLIALSHPQFATPLNRLHYGVLLPASIKRATRIIVPSKAVRQELTARFPVRFPRVVELGLEPAFFETPSAEAKADVRKRYHLPERYLLFVGNFEPKKNLKNVLRALEMVPDAPPLVIAGGNRAWAGHEMHSSTRTHVTGYVARADLPALYAGCSAFVFPSLAEGFGLPVLEALACGAPVVTSRTVPLPELEQAVLICNPNSATSIAEGISRILHEPGETERLRTAGQEYAKPYTWRRAAREILAIYRELA